MTVFSMDFMSQELGCEMVDSLLELCLPFLSFSRATSWLGWELCPSLSRGKMARAACREGKALTFFNPLETTASDKLLLSKSILAPVLPIKSIPSKPAALVGSEHT
jgi:hypothetical protein